jgi:hypothetical protein
MFPGKLQSLSEGAFTKNWRKDEGADYKEGGVMAKRTYKNARKRGPVRQGNAWVIAKTGAG